MTCSIQLTLYLHQAATKNSHVAEERGQAIPGHELDEEERSAWGTRLCSALRDLTTCIGGLRYSGVVRAANAYIPPGARRLDTSAGDPKMQEALPTLSSKPIITPTEMMRSKSQALENTSAGMPKVSIEDHDGSAAAPKPSTVRRVDENQKQSHADFHHCHQQPNSSNDRMDQLRNFVDSEREKLSRTKSSMAKSEKERRLAELISFGKSFKVINERSPCSAVGVHL